jgi:hypothetical protein
MRPKDYQKYQVGKNVEAAAQGLKAHAFFTTAGQSAALRQWAESTIAQGNIFHDFILREISPRAGLLPLARPDSSNGH